MRRLTGVALALAALLTLACGESHEDDPLSKTTLTKLEMTDLTVGTGAEARNGRRVAVHYTGWLYHPTRPEHKGRQFDSSRSRQPFDLTLGMGEVIPGWDQGLLGMKAGGSRRLVIPSALGYGRAGHGSDIPPDATLVFDVELVSVQ
jgi:FKBP-type peptidyl-prolyl cis-trans isomerase FkpA